MAKASFVKNVNIEIDAPASAAVSSSGTVSSGSGSPVSSSVGSTGTGSTSGSPVTGNGISPVAPVSPGSSSGTAPPDVSGNTGSNTELVNNQDVQTAVRLDPNFLRLGDSVRVGRIRTQEEDQISLFARQKVEIAASKITSTTRAQSMTDIVRHKQKNQARCNHLFDISNGRCLWCNKDKTSQIYDQ